MPIRVLTLIDFLDRNDFKPPCRSMFGGFPIIYAVTPSEYDPMCSYCSCLVGTPGSSPVSEKLCC